MAQLLFSAVGRGVFNRSEMIDVYLSSFSMQSGLITSEQYRRTLFSSDRRLIVGWEVRQALPLFCLGGIAERRPLELITPRRRNSILPFPPYAILCDTPL